MSDAIARATEFGIREETAKAVVEAFAKLSTQCGRAFDPAAWSRTVWMAEAQRYDRSASPQAHYSLLLHINRLRDQWEERYRQGTRGWYAGKVGERLTKR